MARKSINYYLMKTARLTGWLLLALMLLFMLTGFSLRGELGFDDLIGEKTALKVHQLFRWPLVVVFLLHSVITIYFAMRRWRWIGKRRKVAERTGPPVALTEEPETPAARPVGRS